MDKTEYQVQDLKEIFHKYNNIPNKMFFKGNFKTHSMQFFIIKLFL